MRETSNVKRESFKSRLGFLLVSAGCAIGIGNVWRFPYVVGENGGGIFVLFYLLFCVTKWGWGFDNYLEEVNTGRGRKLSAKLKPYFQFILPLLIVFILIQGFV